MIPHFSRIEYADKLKEGTDKINQNFENVREYLSRMNIVSVFTAKPTVGNVPIRMSDEDGLGIRLSNRTVTWISAAITAVDTDEGSSNVASFTLLFSIDVRNDTPTLVGDLAVIHHHDGLPGWEVVGIEFDGPYAYIKIRSDEEILWTAHVSITEVPF